MNFDSDTNVIDVAIRRLRSKSDDGFSPKLIQTTLSMWYMVDLPGEQATLQGISNLMLKQIEQL